jgi:hypothetical protein
MVDVKQLEELGDSRVLVDARDVVVLIGMVVSLQGQVLVDAPWEPDMHRVLDRLRDDLVAVGSAPNREQQAVSEALHALNYRLRGAIGEPV